MIKTHFLFAICALSGFIAVTLGAFGAHGLSQILDAKAMGWWQTAVQYQFYHTALGLVLCLAANLSALSDAIGAKLKLAAAFALIGILLFSGSLYVMALTGLTKLGMVTPIGGLCFLIAWVMAAWQFFKIEQ